MKTRFTETFGIEHPIVMGGMTGVGNAELVAAVANAGALAMLTAHNQPTAEGLMKEIARTREMTDKPFGVNMTILPSINPIPYDEYRRVIIESGIKIVETAGRNPEPHLPDLKANGVKVIHKATSVRHSLTAQRIGVDAIAIDGFECAGHPGEDDVPLMVLLPAAAEALDIIIIASGGIGDARGLVASLALGADAVNMGSRFMATKEAIIHENIKKQIVENDERGTLLINRTLRNTSRVARNTISEEVVKIQRDPTKTFEDVQELVAGARGRTNALEGGDPDGGIWTVGQIQGLIHDIPSCDELVSRMVTEAEALIQDKLSGMAA